MSTRRLGLAGRVARAFLGSKLTPLLVLASVGLGAFAVWQLPREEEPQIIVPMIDIFVAMPGASPREVEQRLTGPLEKLLWEIPRVEYVYSTSSSDQAMAIVRFKVGQDEEKSILRVRDKLAAHQDLLPAGAQPPLIKPRSIDDVPVLALTLWSPRYTGYHLRRVAAELHDAIKQVPDVSEVTLIGGERRQIRVELDVARLAARGLSPTQVADTLRSANARLPAGRLSRENREVIVEAGGLLRTPTEVGQVVVGTSAGRPVFLRDVAQVLDQGEEPATYVQFGTGPGAADPTARAAGAASYPAVTLAVAKRKGTNAVQVVKLVRHQVERARGTLLPSDVQVTISRDYGETASEKSNELLLHMGIAVLSVSLLVGLALGRREAVIVMLAIPATLALTLTVFFLHGYTLNRITLFALIFSIGILVDDAIVVVENIARHRRLPENRGRPLAEVAVEAVDEVGNPTILATMTVIAAILPMAFVGGLMGPYMRPIPVGASAAMAFSLLVAFVVTPWATVRLLGRHQGEGHDDAPESRMTRLYRHVMGALLRRPRLQAGFLAGVVVLLVGSMVLVGVGWVRVKMLPFDNKSELQVVIDMPEGTTLEGTSRVAQALADVVRRQPEVTSYQSYVGTSGPYTFNGLVRHYFLRRGANVADLQVNLVGKHERKQQSHPIARRLRDELAPVAARLGARIKVVEVPPGPPVLQTLVAEVYGPDYGRQIQVARQVMDRLERLPGVVDIDWYVEDEQPKVELAVDREKAALSGVATSEVARAMRLVLAGEEVGLLHDPREKEDVPLVVRLPRATRSDLGRLGSVRVSGPRGQLVSVSELVELRRTVEPRSIYHKNLQPVVYVTADVAGAIESPVYAMLKLGPEIDRLPLPEGYRLEQHTASQPETTQRYALKWDGEWHITYEVFRDLGLAFAAVLVLIYVLVVAWFQSFLVPLVIMSAIPFSLVGILPAHGALGAFFTATSMIGFIAGAGIVVRNSIILVDFIELRRAQGVPLEQAVIDAGAVRFRPMLLTAAAVVVGAGVILFDPIFQGLAISLMAGEIASLVLSRMTVPVVYFLTNRRRQGAAAAGLETAPRSTSR
jgi:multidrug efflux pump subunit AcrB